MLELTNGPAHVVLDPANGARIVSFTVDGLHLLRVPEDDQGGTHWGSFVMAPWAGRTRHGQFAFAGREYQLEVDSGAHAIHGTVRAREWTIEDVGSAHVHVRCDFGPKWPFAGWAEQVIEVHTDHVALELSLHTTDPAMPAAGGWHPWWRRQLAAGGTAELDQPAGSMLERDHEGIATARRLSPPPPGPWDDCFTDFSGSPVLRWPGAVELTLGSDCAFVVVYDEPAEAVCVEPQSGPPDALNSGPAIARPDQPVVVHSSWGWRT